LENKAKHNDKINHVVFLDLKILHVHLFIYLKFHKFSFAAF